MLIRSLIAVAVLGLAACTPQSTAGPAAAEASTSVHPISKLDIVPLTITSGEKAHHFRVEVARTSKDQARGLMFRTALAPDEGMIFPRNPADIASFWMKNTVISLDIIFVGKDRRILNIAAHTVPLSLEPASAIGPTSVVLEIPGGRAAELGIKAGDTVAWKP